MKRDPCLVSFVRESNRIEGITRNPRESELSAHETLLGLDVVTVADLTAFVAIVQPGAVLRNRPGLDVRVGNHNPPRGGPDIVPALERILRYAHGPQPVAGGVYHAPPFVTHHEYETLHPFTDGNGRSGRALWAWQMIREEIWPGIRLGFLHAWYYQSLDGGLR